MNFGILIDASAMKQTDSMRASEYGALPSIASPCYGISSLSFRPYTKWHDSSRAYHVPPADKWSTQYVQQMTENRQTSLNREGSTSVPHLPKDPRLWSREDVAAWVQLVVTQHRLPLVQLDRFLMNGKALCLMTMDMFVKRVPLGGKLLYKDFQLRLSSALYC